MSPIVSTLAGASARGYGGLLSQASRSSFESIETYTATGTVSDITFSTIPSTYKMLQFRLLGRTVSAGAGDRTVFAQFNGDTGSNYYFSRIYSYSGTNNKGVDHANAAGVYASIVLDDGNNTGDFGGNVLEIIDYANTSKTKQVRQLGGSSASQFVGASYWTGTAAISSVRFFISSGGSFKVNSTIALYGIKG